MVARDFLTSEEATSFLPGKREDALPPSAAGRPARDQGRPIVAIHRTDLIAYLREGSRDRAR
jgi:hypothetical protein